MMLSIMPSSGRQRALIPPRAYSAVHNLLNQNGIAHYPSVHDIADWTKN